MTIPWTQQNEAWEGAAQPAQPAPIVPAEAAPMAAPRLLAVARTALAEAETLPEITRLIDRAEVVRVAARKAQLSRDAQNDWGEYRLDAERKAGATLRRMSETGERAGAGQYDRGNRGNRGKGDAPSPLPTLVELGIADDPDTAKQRASRWQQLAAIPAATYEGYKAEMRATDDGVITQAGALAMARRVTGSAHARSHARRAAAVEAALLRRADGATRGALPFDRVAYGTDALTYLRGLPDGCADLCVTSPPYWAKREYTGDARELGREPAPTDYVARLVEIVNEVGRVLAPTGYLLLSLADTYATEPGRYRGDPERARGVSDLAVRANGSALAGRAPDVAEKSLAGIPWRVALELTTAHGWRLANVVAWVKPNHQPENVYDRLTQAWEPILLLTRATHAYFERSALPDTGDVWTIPAGRRGAAAGHLAPFPEALVERAIACACPPGGTVLDPFAGSGTALEVAVRLGRRFLGADLSPPGA